MPQFLGFRLTVFSLIVGFIALAVVVAMTFWLNVRTQAVFEQVAAARALNTEAVSLRSALQAAESSQRGYLYTQNEIYLAPYEVAKTQARKQLELLKSGLSEYPDLAAASARLSEVVAKKWSVRQTERATQPAHPKKAGRETEAERDVRQRLQRALGTRVDLKHQGGKGTLSVHVASFAELESLMERFGA